MSKRFFPIILMALVRFLELWNSLGTMIQFTIYNCIMYPLCRYALPKIKKVSTHVIFHLITGIFECFLLFGLQDGFVTLGVITVCYFLLLLSAFWASILSFGLVMLTHIYINVRGINWALDITGIIMVVFQKTASLSYNLEDGKRIKNGEKVRERWAISAILEKPSFFRFFAYCVTPFGSYSNPFIEYKVFDYMIHVGERKTPITEEDHRQGLKKFIYCLLTCAFVGYSLSRISFKLYETDLFNSLNPFFRVIYVMVVTIATTLRYFCAWFIVEASLLELGVGSAGIYPSADEISNMSMLAVLDSGSCQEWMRRWNHTTHLFWKNYLFSRMIGSGYSKTLASNAVFFASAMWHGPRPVFYLMLPGCFFMMKVDDIWNKKFKQDRSNWISRILHDFHVSMCMLYATSTWFYPFFHEFWYLRTKMAFIPVVWSAVLLLVILAVPKSKPKKAPEAPKQE